MVYVFFFVILNMTGFNHLKKKNLSASPDPSFFFNHRRPGTFEATFEKVMQSHITMSEMNPLGDWKAKNYLKTGAQVIRFGKQRSLGSWEKKGMPATLSNETPEVEKNPKRMGAKQIKTLGLKHSTVLELHGYWVRNYRSVHKIWHELSGDFEDGALPIFQ